MHVLGHNPTICQDNASQKDFCDVSILPHFHMQILCMHAYIPISSAVSCLYDYRWVPRIKTKSRHLDVQTEIPLRDYSDIRWHHDEPTCHCMDAAVLCIIFSICATWSTYRGLLNLISHQKNNEKIHMCIPLNFFYFGWPFDIYYHCSALLCRSMASIPVRG